MLLRLGALRGNAAAIRSDHGAFFRIEAIHMCHVHGLVAAHHAVTGVCDDRVGSGACPCISSMMAAAQIFACEVAMCPDLAMLPKLRRR